MSPIVDEGDMKPDADKKVFFEPQFEQPSQAVMHMDLTYLLILSGKQGRNSSCATCAYVSPERSLKQWIFLVENFMLPLLV